MWQHIRSFLFPKRTNIALSSENVGALASAPLGAIIEDFPDAIILYDPNFTVLALNGPAETLFGVHREEVRGITIDPGFMERPRYRLLSQILFPSLAPSSVERSEAGAWPHVVALIFENPHREFLTHTTRIVSTTGEPIAFIKIVRDETRTKEVFARESEFVSVAAHQLRTPLTALRWSLESMEGAKAKKEETGTLMKDSIALVDRCLKIVNDFLDAAKIEEGKFGFTYETSDLVEFLGTLVTTVTPIAQQYEVTIYFEHEGISSLSSPIDASRLGTALLNVLDNAIRYNVKGGRVTITLEKDAARAKISIADTGIGIPKGDEKKLFQKLERGANAIQVEPNGSGLGLYIAKNIIEGHGGTITVASEPNRGTTFVVTLPLKNNQ